MVDAVPGRQMMDTALIAEFAASLTRLENWMSSSETYPHGMPPKAASAIADALEPYHEYQLHWLNQWRLAEALQ
jgi:hypothetical protein